MTRYCQHWCYRLGLASCLAISGAITLLSFANASWENYALAQITPDTTLGNENSAVTSTGAVDSISGGATRGTNLLHSFEEFNVGEGRSAYFNNPAPIENILSRVTGGNPSQILGKLGVLGNANLFLINPNGIIFGRNSSLDVKGSFVGTTANGIGLNNGDIFSANSREPLPSGLLNVNPNALLFNQIKAAAIGNSSVAPSGLNPSFDFTATGLRVPDGKSLLLVGGDINIDGGGLYAFGGRVELGALAGVGTVGLNGNSNNLSLSFPDSVERGDVSLSNKTEIDVAAGNGGDIVVNAHNLNILGESILSSGIRQGLGTSKTVAGDITLNVTEDMVVNEASTVINSVLPQATGKGGNINITAGSLLVTDGGLLNTNTYGQGNAGNININARNTVSFNGEGSDGNSSGARSAAELGAVGNGGNIEITAGSLSVTKGAELVVLTRVQGNAGNININARDTVSFDGKHSNGLSSVASSTVEKGAEGNSGNINIHTGSLLLTDAGVLNTSTYGQGDAGNININARDTVYFSGEGAAYNFVQKEAIGNGGSINIHTGSLFAKSGAALSASTYGQGNAGSINIKARDTVSFDGVGRNRESSGASSSVGSRAIGNGGSIDIHTGSLLVTDGAILFAGTQGEGNAGTINIKARDTVSFDGVGRNGLSSSARSTVSSQAIGNSGGIDIHAESLLVTNGAFLSTGTIGRGNAGNINIKARDTVSFDGVGSDGFFSGARSTTGSQAMGNSGSIDIQAESLLVTNGAFLFARSQGSNNVAGNILVRAGSIRLDHQAVLNSETQGGEGNIFLDSQTLILRRNSNITTNATGENIIGGNINIDTNFLIASENSDISANSANFRGGNVRIDASGIFGTQFRNAPSDRTSDITATGASPELGGTVELDTPGVDPNRGLVSLPVVPVNTQVSQACTPGGSQQQSEFVVTGRGGLPQNPGESLNTDAVQVDLVTLSPQAKQPNTTEVSASSNNPTPTPLIEAQSWAIAANGKIILTANVPTVTPHNSWQKTANCKSGIRS